jgi:S1/P1 nuclease
MLSSRRTLAAAVFIAIGFFAVSISLSAFGDSGHRIIGAVAALHLKNTRALTEATSILRPGETLADASVWADRIKDALYEDEDTPLMRLNHPSHDSYHFTNVPLQAEQYSLAATGARPTDIVQMIRECIRVLKAAAPQPAASALTRRQALRLLAHLVGDLHQPLHVGNAFIGSSGPLRFVAPVGPSGWRATQGGNLLLYGADLRFNLHSYWDTHAVNLTMGQEDVDSVAARLVAEIHPTSRWNGLGSVDSWPAQWATESLAIAKEAHRGIMLVSYLGPDETKRALHRWSIELPQDYDARARPIVRQQLAAGGYRLAAILKAIWP